jgi:hypothetical protein
VERPVEYSHACTLCGKQDGAAACRGSCRQRYLLAGGRLPGGMHGLHHPAVHTWPWHASGGNCYNEHCQCRDPACWVTYVTPTTKYHLMLEFSTPGPEPQLLLAATLDPLSVLSFSPLPGAWPLHLLCGQREPAAMTVQPLPMLLFVALVASLSHSGEIPPGLGRSATAADPVVHACAVGQATPWLCGYV